MKMYNPKQSNIEKLIASRPDLVKYKRIKIVLDINEVVPCKYYEPSLNDLVESGLSKNEAFEVIDRVCIHKKNRIHSYSSQLRHLNGTPIAVRKEKIANPNKGLKKY